MSHIAACVTSKRRHHCRDDTQTCLLPGAAFSSVRAIDARQLCYVLREALGVLRSQKFSLDNLRSRLYISTRPMQLALLSGSESSPHRLPTGAHQPKEAPAAPELQSWPVLLDQSPAHAYILVRHRVLSVPVRQYRCSSAKVCTRTSV